MIENIIQKMDESTKVGSKDVTLSVEEISLLLDYIQKQEEEIEKSMDREYAIKQVEMLIKFASNEFERKQYENLRTLFSVLPNTKDLERQVYCSECQHFSVTEGELNCPYSDLCHFWNPEDSAPIRLRPCYTPSFKKEKEEEQDFE